MWCPPSARSSSVFRRFRSCGTCSRAGATASPSPSTTRGVTATRWSGPPAARRRGTTSPSCPGSVRCDRRSSCTPRIWSSGYALKPTCAVPAARHIKMMRWRPRFRSKRGRHEGSGQVGHDRGSDALLPHAAASIGDAHMNRIMHVLIGDLPTAGDVAIKTAAVFLTAAILFRFTERRTLAEFAPFDWIAAVAAGAIVGRAATASDTSWLGATTALLCLLAAHAVLARLRLIPALCRFIAPPLMVLISDGEVNRRNVRRCGLTTADLEAVLREHGHRNADRIHLAILEAKGAISVLAADMAVEPREGAEIREI